MISISPRDWQLLRWIQWHRCACREGKTKYRSDKILIQSGTLWWWGMTWSIWRVPCGWKADSTPTEYDQQLCFLVVAWLLWRMLSGRKVTCSAMSLLSAEPLVALELLGVPCSEELLQESHVLYPFDTTGSIWRRRTSALRILLLKQQCDLGINHLIPRSTSCFNSKWLC